VRQGQEQGRGAVFGLAAAALFGASAPMAKRLLPEVPPVLLAGLLYGGAGLGLTLLGLIRRAGGALAGPSGRPREAALRASDLPLLIGIVGLGGVAGPILMLVGLQRLSGISGALLLNLEAPLTALAAVLLFREHLSARSAAAAGLIVAGATLLGQRPGGGGSGWAGAAAVGAACLAWAIDNNLTQRLSLRDPIAVVRIKALAAGACNLAIAAALGQRLPALPLVGAALAVGCASYGASVVLDVYALRLLGAAREAAYFATAPFVGALVAVPVLHETWGRAERMAGAAMIAGVVLLLRERHSHSHSHAPLEHDHLHVHDVHHQHPHEHATEPGPGGAAHSHPHRHQPLRHEHPHSSDVHHRHSHRQPRRD
jgi:drug/metabolite transporter (DMT)-like permease